MWISAFEKNEFLINIWFLVHLCSQIRMQTFLEISPNFYNHYRWHDFVSVYLLQLVKYQSLSLPWEFTISVPPVKKKNLHERFHTALVNFHHNVLNCHALAINLDELLVHALSITSYIIADSEFGKHACKSNTVPTENSLYLLVN